MKTIVLLGILSLFVSCGKSEKKSKIETKMISLESLQSDGIYFGNDAYGDLVIVCQGTSATNQVRVTNLQAFRNGVNDSDYNSHYTFGSKKLDSWELGWALDEAINKLKREDPYSSKCPTGTSGILAKT